MKFSKKLIVFILTLLALAASAHAISQREELQQMVVQLQKSPNDDALREKIIKFAAGIKPAPTIPEPARRHFVKAITLQKEAKTVADYQDVVSEYQASLSFAPWAADTYYNLAAALEASSRFNEAKGALQFYLFSNPQDGLAVQDRIYALEARQEKAEREKSVHDWLLGEWQLSDELKTAGGEVFSPAAPITVKSVKEGEAVVFRAGGQDFLRATPRGDKTQWEHWKPVPYKSIGCPEDGAWNRVEVTAAADQRRLSFAFHESFTGTCGRQTLHTYVLSR